jgi:penicillin-binding protein 1C
LNRIDFGNLNFGIASAASYYFGKPLGDLSNAEAALLAGLPLNPARLNPHTNPDGAKRRQTTVLRRMLENGWLNAEQHQQALDESLRYRAPQRTFLAPHFVDLVLQSVASPAEKTEPGDMRPRVQGRVTTTLDLELNRFIQQSITEKLAKLRDHNVHDAAAVVLENRSGEILGLVGSGDYFAPGTGEVNGSTQPRSAGSTIKPITYLLALERGDTPATILADVPTEFTTDTGPYRPENYSRHCQGPVRFREALACSLNIPAVRLLQSLGGALPLQRRLQAWGITTLPRDPAEYGLGLTIGNAEVRLLELANLFATLARQGEFRPVRIIPGLDYTRHAIPRPATPAIKPELFWLIADILADNAARQPQFGGASPLRFDFPVACKTGTSTDFRDNWAVGYTPEFTVAVWVGNFDGSPMNNVSGVSGAGPILHDIVQHLHDKRGTTWFSRPPGITERTVHPLTGHTIAEPREGSIFERFAEWQIPPSETPADYDAEGRVLLGAEFGRWTASTENHLGARVAIRSDGNIQIVSPASGSTFVLDPDIPTTALVPVLANSDNIHWESDTLKFRTQGGKTYAIAVEGRHRITARDTATGKTASTTIQIRSL